MRSRRFAVERLSSDQWRMCASKAHSLPIVADPDWADALHAVHPAAFRPRAWSVRAEQGDALVVGYEWGRHVMPSLDLSPFGLPAGLAPLDGYLSESQTMAAFIKANWARYRSITCAMPFYAAAADNPPCHSTHVLSLDMPYESLFMTHFAGRTRTSIRRSQRAGVVSTITSDEDLLSQYYAVHVELAAAKGTYGKLHPEDLLRRFIQGTKRCQLAVSLVDGKVVAGGIFFDDGPTTLYWHGATDRRYAEMQPVYALLSMMIQRAIADGKTYFNLGGSAGIHSLERFKESWGATRRTAPVISHRNPVLARGKHLAVSLLPRVRNTKASK